MSAQDPVAPSRAASLLRATALAVPVGVAAGVASAVFLLLLERVTSLRESHEGLVWLLPTSGLLLGLAYERWGAPIKGGNNLVLETLHVGGPPLPLRMAPMVLAGTLVTHLFGGSAGREGTAVQMASSLADQLATRLRVTPEARRALLVAGMAGGFGSVFGTPFAGALFAIEVVCIGSLEVSALAPALVASLVGDRVTRALGVTHASYPQAPWLSPSPAVLLQLTLIGIAMALATVAFVELTRRLKALLERTIPRLPLRAFVGACAVIALWRVLGTSDYLGLGVPTILRAFSDPSLSSYAFAAKLVFTALTLACGFVGGEVTPLFFVGATLGSVLARAMGLPIEVGAGVGIAAVFGASANTPLALTVMAAELVGVRILPYAMLVCGVAFVLSGHRGIYDAQRIARRKSGRAVTPPVRLRELR